MVGKVFTEQKLRVVLAIGALAVSTAVNYLIVYMPTYVVKTLDLAPTVGFTATLAAAVAVTILTPVAGTVSDRVGRTTHMIAVGLLLLVSVFPAFLLLTRTPVAAVIVLAVLYLATLKALYFGPLAALMSELFPPATRASVLDVGCGHGYVHPTLLEAGHKVTGVEIAADVLDIARKAHPEVDYRTFDGEVLPFPDEPGALLVVVCGHDQMDVRGRH